MSENGDYGAPGKSLIREIELLREAVLRLCELQQALDVKVTAVIENKPPITVG